MELLYLAIGLVIGAASAWLIRKYRFELQKGIAPEEVEKLTVQINTLQTEKAKAEERNSNIESTVSEMKDDLSKERNRAFAIQSKLSKSEADLENMQQRLTEQRSELDKMQKRFTTEFENLANRIFEDKSRKFTDINKTNIDEILKPLNEKIKDFQKRVEETYDKEAQQRSSLKTEIEKLYNLNQLLSKEANNLTTAIKGESQTQGVWGEIILERILEKSGLQKGREFLVQETSITDEGKRLRPDITILLPEGKNMIIDSKVTLVAYDRYFSAETSELKAQELQAFLLSVRTHVKELSLKNYQSLYGMNSPDFVLMFIPIEPAFGLSVLNDETLFYDAFEKNVVIVSPSTLLATLRTVANIWRQEAQSRNAMEIARQGGALYDKFVAFVEDLIKIGKQIQATQRTYEDTMTKLYKGQGNLVKRAQDIKNLGAKTSKVLPQTLLDRTDDVENSDHS